MIERRAFLTGLISLVAAPAIVRAGSLMPVKVIELRDDPVHFITEYWDGRVIRYTLPTGDVYGRSPAMDVLADLKDIHERIDRAFFAVTAPPLAARPCP